MPQYCKEDGCRIRASYGYIGGLPIRCAEHGKKNNMVMINKYRKKCDKCKYEWKQQPLPVV